MFLISDLNFIYIYIYNLAILYFRAFDNLWKKHSMNKTQESDDRDPKFDNGEIDVYTLNEDQLWARSELEEMRKPKSTQIKKSSVALVQSEDVEGEGEKVSKKKATRVKTQGTDSGAEGRPDFYHGVGPFNDVNFPGVWFFRIPHKVCVPVFIIPCFCVMADIDR